ncbi:MAG: PEP/pyruvate-binding domain-containing protein [Pseudomonadota bacterium]
MLKHFRSLFSRTAEAGASSESVEVLRADFKERYHDFKLLITANNRALEVMNDIEQALAGGGVFGMAFVRARCTAVVVNVLQMLIRMSGLSKGKYDPLFARFGEIRKHIETIIAEKSPQMAEPPHLVITLSDVRLTHADTVGSKMAQLGEVCGVLDLPVPDGFAITTAAYRHFMTHNELQTEIDRRIQNLTPGDLKEMQIACAAIQQRIISAAIPPELSTAIAAAYGRLATGRPGLRVAMRSSALGEDMAEQSFAGLYKSRLNVAAEELDLAYKEIVASKYGLSAVAYRLKRGLRDEDIAMGVGCLAMVDAAAGGVMYSRHPVDPEAGTVFINAVLGLPKAVVDGTGGFDQIEVSRQRPLSVLRETITRKTEKFTCDPIEGVCHETTVATDADQPAITRQTACRLADIALALETHNGAPQDIEWAVDGQGHLFILQSRPMAHGIVDQAATSRIDTTGPLPPPLLSGGATACRGAASGPVFIAKKSADMLRMPEGAVIVARQALPLWSPLVSRAAAVITEEGGAAGHLAHITREFGVPAIFGLSGAVDSLTENAPVTVDATAARVYPGLLPVIGAKAGPMRPAQRFQRSPVYQTLERASRWIVPLNLLDPDSMDFTIANCRTLHDITRLVHERSVSEMFAFGTEHRFPEKSAKQLVDRVPLKWWVLNLDDGFNGPVTGPRVPITQIVSIPMRALWGGITAIPWDGPPPLDGKGLMAVMFRSTTNTALTTGVRSSYAARSYFMITRNYCSLNTRLGYHFCQVETLVGDRDPENYIQFRFKGGAADEQRRLGRIHFVRDILESQEFHVDIRSDALTARVEKRPAEAMCRHLKTIGHLIIHTRQLDMIMSNPASVRFYRNKLMSDLERLHTGAQTPAPSSDSAPG